MGLNSISPATIMMTPAVIVAIMRISFKDGCSRRNRNAKIRMNASAEDLHMADVVPVSMAHGGKVGRPTEKRERDPYEAHVPESDIKTCRCSTRTNPSEVEGPTHKRFALRLITMKWRMIAWVGNAICSGPEMGKKVQDSRGE